MFWGLEEPEMGLNKAISKPNNLFLGIGLVISAIIIFYIVNALHEHFH